MSTTETAASRYAGIEDWPVPDMVEALLEAQMAAVAAVHGARADLARAIEAAAERLRGGGRLVYLGAGTSGRIATQDAAELAPTFAWPTARALSLMAGGTRAFTEAIEGAEDDGAAAVAALRAAEVGADDVVIGVAASGRTPFTVAGLAHARAQGALTIGVYNNAGGQVGEVSEIALLAATGAEAIAGSTRLRAGTAQKVVLNCLSTGVMLRLGFVYRGRMVEMRATNAKLRDRAIRMVADLTGAGAEASEAALGAADGSIKTAVVMLSLGLDAQAAAARIKAAGGTLGAALG
jgi:N-acetylmuramic acid 6-phosphate etherase